MIKAWKGIMWSAKAATWSDSRLQRQKKDMKKTQIEVGGAQR